MRDRILTRKEAVEEYLSYQIRLYDYLHTVQIILDLKDGVYKPHEILGHGPEYFSETVRNVSYGFFANLMDSQNHALNIFDVWRVLFPDQEKDIVATWERIKPYDQLIKDYRNNVCFHINKDLKTYFAVRRCFRENRPQIMEAMQCFWDLAARLIRLQAVALPDFRSEIHAVLKAAVPDFDEGQLERAKDFFIQN